MPTVADVLVENLEAANVKHIYGIVGDSLNAITNSLSKRKKIQWVHCRHEEAAAFAAGAAAQLTGALAVCAGSCGPGNLHLINGLYDSHRSHAPVLAIAAQIPTVEIGGNYFQETDPLQLFKDCSHYCGVVHSPEQMPRILNIAIQTAIAKKGVAVIVISGDIALLNAENTLVEAPQVIHPRIIPSAFELEEIAEYINASKSTAIFCGSGAIHAHEELNQFCGKIKAPMVHTLRGKKLESDNPFDVGMTGLIGFASGYYAIESCDTLLLLGNNFPYRQFYPSNAKVIQIDVNGEQLGKRCRINYGAVGDIKDTLNALMPLVNEKTDKSFLDKALAHYKKTREALDDLAKPSSKELIHPQYVARLIDLIASDDAIFTADVGTPTVWAARYLHLKGNRQLLGSFNHGSMANALSQAIGASVTYKDRQVIALCGDGGFAMLMGDILTLLQEKLPIKLIIFNNGTLGFVEMEMKVAGMLDYQTELNNPNFAYLAQSMGIHGVRVENSSELEKAMREVLNHDGPALLDVKVNRTELVMPPSIKTEHVKGFGLFMIKAIMNGKGDQVIDLVKSNLWR